MYSGCTPPQEVLQTMRLGITIVANILLVGGCLTSPYLAAQEPQRTLIRDVTVIDGTGSAGRRGLDVVLSGALIESIQPTTADSSFVGRTISGSGRFLIPGIVDAHVHLSGATRAEVQPLLAWIVQGGVTSVRDMAGDARDLAGIQRALISGELTGPSLYYSALLAGPAFMSDPRLAAATVGYLAGEAPYMIPFTHETDLVQAMAMAKGTGATGIKLYAALDASLVRAATQEAHKIGLQVWAHSAVFPAKPVAILDAGVSGVSHAAYVIWEAEPESSDFGKRGQGNFAGVSASGAEMDRVIAAMVRNATVLDPTLLVLRGADAGDAIPLSLAWSAEFTRRAHEAGVTIAAGSDGVGEPLAGALPAVHDELTLMVDLVGMTPLQALTAGTLGGARAIGNEARSGSIQPGKAADLVLLSADPSVDIRNTRRIVHVIKGGRVVR
jgi:imidazolonepropionase-like amidohydrolase